MTDWTPSLADGDSPVYVRIADALAADVARSAPLAVGARPCRHSGRSHTGSAWPSAP